MTSMRRFFSSIAILLLMSCSNHHYRPKKAIDSTFSYTTADFEKLCKEIENKKMSNEKLRCKFLSKYDSAIEKNEIVYSFVLWKNKETADTCWGVITYDRNAQTIRNCGIFCQ